MWPYTHQAIAVISVNTVLAMLLTFWVWRRRHATYARPLFISTLAAALWSLGYLIELCQTHVAGLDFWNRVQYLFIQTILVTWPVFVIRYTGHAHRLGPGRLVILGLIPALTVILAWSNDLHHLIWQEITLNVNGAVPSTLAVRGLWYWVAAVYAYLILLFVTLLLARAFFRSPAAYRRQVGVLLLALLVPWLANILHVARLEPIPGLELTPLSFTFTNAMFAWGLFRLRLLDLVPVARAAVVEQMPDAVIVLDSQQRVVDLNPAAGQLLGCPAHSVGQPAQQVLGQWPGLVVYCHSDRDIRAEVALDIGGTQHILDLRLSLLGRRDGRQHGVMVVLRDITERARAAEQREALIQELDAFAHTVAHDLKNPLTSIIAYSDFMLTFQQSDPEMVTKCLRTIEQTGRKMESIISELLLLSSVRSQDHVEMGPLDMADIVGDAQRRLMVMMEESKAEVLMPSSWPVVWGYAGWVEEVWANYLSNAVKYGGRPELDIPPRIELGATNESGGLVRFWVRDNGPGIPSDKLEGLFTRFVRLDQMRAQGHGLGLSIVRRIVSRLDGQVGVESQVGRGSTFWFTLPAAPSGGC